MKKFYEYINESVIIITVMFVYVIGTLTNDQILLEFADENKCYCQFDLFGTECSFYQLNPIVDMQSDAQRIDRVKCLQDDNKLNRVLLSHDIHTKHRLVSNHKCVK